MKKNKSIVSSLIPSTNVGLANEYVSDDTLSLRNSEYHGIVLKVRKKKMYATTHVFIRAFVCV